MIRSSRWVFFLFWIMLSGFDLSRHNIPVEEIQSGGPPKDGIPAILDPKFVSAKAATFLSDQDRVLGIKLGNEAKAYPVRILNWHEIVNDRIDQKPIMVSYCPLCGTGMAFNPIIQNKLFTFGVSGLLYNSDVLMYDHQTESLWSQIKQEAVTGSMMGTRLEAIFLIHTSWLKWRKDHPDTLVLSTDTGYRRDYSRDPYSGYAASSRLYFPVGESSSQFHPKEWVIGLTINREAKGYPFSELSKHSSSFQDRLGGEVIHVHFEAESNTAHITAFDGTPLPTIVGFWFAWYAFHPQTSVYVAPK